MNIQCDWWGTWILTNISVKFICDALLTIARSVAVVTFSNLPHVCVYRDGLCFIQGHQTYTVCNLQEDTFSQLCVTVISKIHLRKYKRQRGPFPTLPWYPHQAEYAEHHGPVDMGHRVDLRATGAHGCPKSSLHSAEGTELCIQNQDPWDMLLRCCLPNTVHKTKQ